MTVVLPGDVVSIPSTSAIKLGPGLLPTPRSGASSPSLTAIRTGALGTIASTSTSTFASSSSSPSSNSKLTDPTALAFWVETNTYRYVPAPGDSVIAQITHRGSESYTLSLFSAHSATLPALSFEGATKRHKPNLRIGSLVYARIVSADRFNEPELTCVNPVTGKSDGFGHLKTTDQRGQPNGHAMLFRISLGLARSLLRPTHALLKLIATHFAFEAAIGQNGAVWIRANQPNHVIAVGKVLEAADYQPIFHTATSVQHSFHHNNAQDQEQGAQLDAEQVLKNRALTLDAKQIHAIVQHYL